jgi:hypothetical protein
MSTIATKAPITTAICNCYNNLYRLQEPTGATNTTSITAMVPITLTTTEPTSKKSHSSIVIMEYKMETTSYNQNTNGVFVIQLLLQQQSQPHQPLLTH